MEELASAVRAAAESSRDDPRQEENVFTVLPQEGLRSSPEERVDDLSERQLEILLLAARGLSNRQVAVALRLSEATVKRHLADIYPKIGAASRGGRPQGPFGGLDLRPGHHQRRGETNPERRRRGP